jgi:hypothetical protein
MPTNLDPILEARLDLLEQALAEVDKILYAMIDQRERLEQIQLFLTGEGGLKQIRKKLWTSVMDALNRIEGPPLVADDLMEEDLEDDTGDGDTGWSEQDHSRLQAVALLNTALQQLNELEQARHDARKHFQEIQQWSVAGLVEEQLDAAARQYRSMVDLIRRAPDPWQAYEQQLRGRGEQLFTAYLDLLSSMAVRDVGIIDDRLAKDRKELLKLLKPRGYLSELPNFPAPNLLTGTEHVQLGYFGWSLWALPLIARHAGLDLIKRDVFSTEIPDRLQILCADAFALYTMGPSYACAAIYLELDPDDATSDGISDAIRAEVLLDGLPKLGDDPERRVLESRAEQLRNAWNRARAAVHGEEVSLAEDDQKIVDRFLDELRGPYNEMAYSMRGLAHPVALAEELAAAPPVGPDPGMPPIRDLLIAMWWGRLDHPGYCPKIHQRARDIASRAASALGPLQRRSRSGTGRAEW